MSLAGEKETQEEAKDAEVSRKRREGRERNAEEDRSSTSPGVLLRLLHPLRPLRETFAPLASSCVSFSPWLCIFLLSLGLTVALYWPARNAGLFPTIISGCQAFPGNSSPASSQEVGAGGSHTGRSLEPWPQAGSGTRGAMRISNIEQEISNSEVSCVLCLQVFPSTFVIPCSIFDILEPIAKFRALVLRPTA